MEIIFQDMQWMLFNLSLAVIPVLLICLIMIYPTKLFRFFTGLTWLLFLPNTFYLVSDFRHFFENAKNTSFSVIILLLFLYIFLALCGLITFFVSEYPIDYLISQSYGKLRAQVILISVNFLVGIAIIMGLSERTNSWEGITNPVSTLQSFIIVLTHANLITAAIIWGIGTNVCYFLIKEHLGSSMIRNRKRNKQ